MINLYGQSCEPRNLLWDHSVYRAPICKSSLVAISYAAVVTSSSLIFHGNESIMFRVFDVQQNEIVGQRPTS